MAAAVVDASTFVGKHMMGYQGWFGCPGDGSALDRWFHWCPQDARELTAATASFDAWPDVSHLGEAELFGSSLGLTASGEPARVYSAFNGETVRKHVRWQPNRTWTACSCSASRASCTR